MHHKGNNQLIPSFLLEIFENPKKSTILTEKYKCLQEETRKISTWTRQEYLKLNDEFREKNRYLYRIPYEGNRVKLKYSNATEFDEYINASPLKLEGVKYIATQAPLENTFSDFWHMVWEQEISIVIILVVLQKNRCERYWPDEHCPRVDFHDLTVSYRREEIIMVGHLVKRIFMIEKEGECREISQFHYLSWPDHGIPNSISPLKALLDMLDWKAKYKNPLLVHCSAGIGRTGAFCVIDILLTLLWQQITFEEDPIPGIVYKLRQQRNGLVETEEQFYFIYDFLWSYFTENE